MILVDTSAWVEHDRRTESAVDLRLTGLLKTPALIAVTEPVVMEVLNGANDQFSERRLRRLLAQVIHLPFVIADFEGASGLYRKCRAAGVTPRGALDCMIAAVALRRDVPVLAHDRDFARMADAIGLELDVASLPA